MSTFSSLQHIVWFWEKIYKFLLLNLVTFWGQKIEITQYLPLFLGGGGGAKKSSLHFLSMINLLFFSTKKNAFFFLKSKFSVFFFFLATKMNKIYLKGTPLTCTYELLKVDQIGGGGISGNPPNWPPYLTDPPLLSPKAKKILRFFTVKDLFFSTGKMRRDLTDPPPLIFCQKWSEGEGGQLGGFSLMGKRLGMWGFSLILMVYMSLQKKKVGWWIHLYLTWNDAYFLTCMLLCLLDWRFIRKFTWWCWRRWSWQNSLFCNHHSGDNCKSFKW